MTVDAPDFDPELEGHAAIEIGELVHAVVTAYGEGGEQQVTDCGRAIRNEIDIQPRSEWDGDEMCPKCWPAPIV